MHALHQCLQEIMGFIQFQAQPEGRKGVQEATEGTEDGQLLIEEELVRAGCGRVREEIWAVSTMLF
jgi:hypothetical protein